MVKNPCQIVPSNQSFQKEVNILYDNQSVKLSSEIEYFLRTSLIKLVLFESSKKKTFHKESYFKLISLCQSFLFQQRYSGAIEWGPF